jgi:lysophospholipase L1-like esterase
MPVSCARKTHGTNELELSVKVRLWQALIALVLLAAFEAAARVAYTVQLDLAPGTKWFVYAPDIGWDRRPFFHGTDDCGIERQFGRDGFLPDDLTRLQKNPNQFRALFLGDSSIYGYCLDGDDTVTESANREQPQVSSINLGVPGYSSYQGLRALEKYGERIKPDIIFIAFNYNDRRLVLDPALADSKKTFDQMYAASRIQRFAEAIYLFRAAQHIVQNVSAASPAATGHLPEADIATLKPRVDIESYRQNLTGMVQWAQSRGIATAFILLGDNPAQTRLLNEGIKLLSAGRIGEAIAALEAADNDNDHKTFSLLARLHLAKAYAAANREGEAVRIRNVRDVFGGVHGGYPIALDTEYHRVMREVAVRHDIVVIDAVSELEKMPEVYFDQCHFDNRGQDVVARLAVKAIEAARSGKRP